MTVRERGGPAWATAVAARAEEWPGPRDWLARLLPICRWLRDYDWRDSFFADMSSGLTLAVFMVPTGIAHAGICGVEPVYGLYTSIFPTFLYMVFGNSKYNALGPFAILSVLTQSVIERVNQTLANEHETATNATLLNGTDLADYANQTTATMELFNATSVAAVRPINVATTVMFLSGLFHIVFGMTRADFLSCYLSEQVMSGFVVGGFVHVFFSQIGEVLGIKLPARSGPEGLRPVDALRPDTDSNRHNQSGLGLVLGVFSSSARPVALQSVRVSCAIRVVVDDMFRSLLESLPQTTPTCPIDMQLPCFPPPALPRFDLIPSIFVTTLGIAIVTVAIHLTVVRVVEIKHREKVNSCQELYALGIVSVLSSAFPVFPVTSIFARTLVGDPEKNTTQLTVCFSSLALLAVVLYIGPALEYLPKCILASIVLVSLTAGFEKIRELKHLWPLFKTDLFIFVVTLLLTVFYELAKGLIISVAFAVLTTVVRNQCSAWHFLHQDQDSDEFKEVPRRNLAEVNGSVCVFRFDGPLIFTSVQKFARSVKKAVKRWEKRDTIPADELGFKWQHAEVTAKSTALVIDCSGFPYVDYMGLATLKRVCVELSASNVMVALASPKANLRKMLETTGRSDELDFVFSSVKRAVNALSDHKSAFD